MHLPLELALRPSRLLAAFLLLLHSAALASLLPLAVPAWLRLAVGLALAASAAWSLARHAWLRAPQAVLGLRLQEDGTLELRRRDGTACSGQVQPASAILPFAVVLSVKPASGRRAVPVVIAADVLGPDEARQLRLWLRWRALLSGAAA